MQRGHICEQKNQKTIDSGVGPLQMFILFASYGCDKI